MPYNDQYEVLSRRVKADGTAGKWRHEKDFYTFNEADCYACRLSRNESFFEKYYHYQFAAHRKGSLLFTVYENGLIKYEGAQALGG